MPRLQVLNGKRQGAIFEIEPRREMMIGHRQSADITIDDPWVSWDHAKVVYDLNDATCWIEDLNSTNGTFVNCERVKREQLRHEDIVFLGKTHVIFLAPVEEHSQALFEHSGPSAGHAPPPPPPPSHGAPPPLRVSSAQGFLQGSEPDAFSGSGEIFAGSAFGSSSGSRSQEDPFEDSSVDPFSSDPHEEDDLDWNRPAARESGGLRQTRPESDAPSPSSASQPRLNLSELQSDADLDLPSPSPREISNLISESDSFGDSFDDLNDILGDGRALTPPPAPIPRDFQDLGDARTLPLPDELPGGRQAPPPSGRQAPPPSGDPSSGRPAASNARTQPVTRDPLPPPADPGLPGGHVPNDPKALAFERARLEDEVRRLRAALEAASQQHPEAVRIAANVLRDQELGRLARRVAELEGEVVDLRRLVEEREAELDEVTEDMIRKEDEIETLTTRLKRSNSGPVPQSHAPPLPQPTFDPGSEDFTSLEF
ncbi:MAG: FHA domain-containing protein [Planctomycetota bacterium]